MFLLLTGVRIGELSALCWEDIDWNKRCINISKTMSTGYVKGKKIEIVTTPKTASSYRSIPFFEETEKLLYDWHKKQDAIKKELGNRWRTKPEHGNLVFTTTMGSPVTRYSIRPSLNRINKNLQMKEKTMAAIEGRFPREIKNIHPHAFRHTFATRCFEKDMSPIVVQAMMGHARYDVTISYTHILDDKMKSEVSRVGCFLG